MKLLMVLGRVVEIKPLQLQRVTILPVVSLDTMGGNWQLKLNGHKCFYERCPRYFTRTQVWQHHTVRMVVSQHMENTILIILSLPVKGIWK